jgi:hypothetical protein
MASRGLTSLALVCASLAWAGYVFLHTVGDPTRAEDIATAVLEDEASREELASSFALQIVRATGVDRSNIDLVEGAVAQALADPRITTDLVSAFGSAHANALGVDDPRPTTISPDVVLDAVTAQVAAVSPEIAAQLSAQLPEGVLPEITLPTFHPPGVDTARRAADSATGALALTAAALLVVAFALGERRRVLRGAGIWAVVAGVTWVLVPIGIVAGARAWASGADRIVEAAVRASVDGVAPVAIGLLVSGVVAIVLSLVPALWPERNDVMRRGTVVQGGRAGGYPYGYAPGVNPAAHPAAGRVGTTPPAATAVGAPPAAPFAPTTTSRVDTYVPTGAAAAPQAVAQPRPPAPGAPAAPATSAPAAPPRPAADDVDPWAAYFGPDQQR